MRACLVGNVKVKVVSIKIQTFYHNYGNFSDKDEFFDDYDAKDENHQDDDDDRRR